MTDWLRPLEPKGRPKKAPAPQATQREPISFERAVERFAAQYVSRKTGRPFSATSKRNVIDNLLGSPLTSFRLQRGITTVEQWSGDHAAEYLRWLQTDMRRDSATVKKVRGQLRSFADFCAHELHTTSSARSALDTLRVSPADDYDRPMEPALTHMETETLLDAAPKRRDRLVIAILLFTGMRPSELLALDEKHVRLDRNPPVVEIRGSVHTAYRPKSEPFRDVPLTVGQTVLPKLIRAYLADSERPARAERLFLSKRGDTSGRWQPLTLEGLRAMLYDLGTTTGIKCNASRFRHTFCTWCADAGVQMLHLQRLLGHKSSDMVACYYQGKTNQAVLDAVARVRF